MSKYIMGVDPGSPNGDNIACVFIVHVIAPGEANILECYMGEAINTPSQREHFDNEVRKLAEKYGGIKIFEPKPKE